MVIPTAFSLGSMIYGYMIKRIVQMQAKIDRKELEKKKVENRLEVERGFKDKSNTDIIMDSIREGRELRGAEAKHSKRGSDSGERPTD